MNTLETISGIIEEYNQCSKEDVTNILLLRDRLAIGSFRLAEITGDAMTQYLRDEFNYKIELAQSIEFHSKKFSHAASKEKAMIEKRLEKEKEIISEGYKNKLKLILNQVNEVLGAMNQRISVAQKERYHANKQV